MKMSILIVVCILVVGAFLFIYLFIYRLVPTNSNQAKVGFECCFIFEFVYMH